MQKPQLGSNKKTKTVATGHGITGLGAAEAPETNKEKTVKRVGELTEAKHASDPREPLGIFTENKTAYDHKATVEDYETGTAAEITGGAEFVPIPAKVTSEVGK